MLDLMPARIAKSKFVGRRSMPTQVGDIHRQPGKNRMRQQPGSTMQNRPAHKRSQSIADHEARQRPQKRHHGSAQ